MAKRLANEYKEYINDPNYLYSINMTKNIFKWEFVIIGPSDTLYEGGIFKGLPASERATLKAATPDLLQGWAEDMIKRGFGNEASEVAAAWRAWIKYAPSKTIFQNNNPVNYAIL